jgi:hypothetical protein
MHVVLLLALIRLVLAFAGLGGAILRGVDTSVALATFGLGVMLLTIFVLATRQGRWSGRDIRAENPLRVAVSALYPSSLGLAALTVFSVVLAPQLAALMAGLLAGLALFAAAIAAQIAWSRH